MPEYTAAPKVREIAKFAALLAEATRASFCLALLDGRAWTAGELARHAGVAASTATEHITSLVEGGLLVDERQGRHRYVRLANWHVAQLIEDMAAFTAPGERPRSLQVVTADEAMAHARTCYDHLAGRLGVAVTDAMTRRRLLDSSAGFAVTADGLRWLDETLGLDAATARSSRRPLVRSCLDWTERRPHLAGLAGAAICRQFLDQRWVVRIGSQRALQVTPSGQLALHTLFNIEEHALTR